MTSFSDVRIFLCTTPTNMSWSFDRLMGRAQEVFDQDPASGHLFLFLLFDLDRPAANESEDSATADQEAEVEVEVQGHRRRRKRRKFFDGVRSCPREAHQVLEWIRQLYDIEDQARDWSVDARRELRAREANPVLDRIEAYLTVHDPGGCRASSDRALGLRPRPSPPPACGRPASGTNVARPLGRSPPRGDSHPSARRIPSQSRPDPSASGPISEMVSHHQTGCSAQQPFRFRRRATHPPEGFDWRHWSSAIASKRLWRRLATGSGCLRSSHKLPKHWAGTGPVPNVHKMR